MTGGGTSRCSRGIGEGVVLGAMLALGPLLLAQVPPPTFNEHEVKGESSNQKTGIWSLDFRFKEPRLIKANIPGRGTRLCWYLWYQVINYTGEPRVFIPDFELVTHDVLGTYHDEVLPSVQEAIKKIEDPTGFQDIQNSVTISRHPIPVSKPAGESYPRAVTGVAIWDAGSGEKATGDRPRELWEATHFSIFVGGLSNGWVLVDPIGVGPEARPVVRRKTLKLDFRRSSSQLGVDTRDVTFVPPAEWIYRASQLRVPDVALPRQIEPPAGR